MLEAHPDQASGAEASAFPAYEFVPGDPASGLILLCDHARNALPAEYGTLGLDEAALERHIGYDIGAAPLTLALAARLGAPAVLTMFSRLLIDPNRGEDDPTLIMRISDGAIVPGNAGVDAAERERRLERFYRPYHRRVAAAIETSLAAGQVPALLSIHSFTPIWRGVPRPWEVGVLWDNDPRLPVPMIAALKADGTLTVGDNEPYSGALANDTLFRHATTRGLPNVLIELRQDLIDHAAGVEAWADRLAAIWGDLAGRAELRHTQPHGSRTGAVVATAAPS